MMSIPYAIPLPYCYCSDFIKIAPDTYTASFAVSLIENNRINYARIWLDDKEYKPSFIGARGSSPKNTMWFDDVILTPYGNQLPRVTVAHNPWGDDSI